MGIRITSWTISLLVTCVAAASSGLTGGCGSSEDSTFPNPDEQGSSGGAPGSSGGDGFGEVKPGVSEDQPIVIDPSQATITIKSRTAKETQPFTAKAGATVVNASWILDKYETGSIDTKGLFTTNGFVGGKVKVSAQYKQRKATADLLVKVAMVEDLPTPPSTPGNKSALQGTPQADPGGANTTKILYPLDGTVMPRGLTSPVLQVSPGSVPPQDLKIALKCSTFSWEGYGKVENPGVPQMQVPQDIWDAFTQSCGGEEATITVVKANGGAAYGPYVTKLVVAAATLKGAVFYQSYQSANLGLWSVRPGVKEPAKHLIAQCVVCHSVSANGETLTTGMDQGGAASGAYRTKLDGTIMQVSKTPNLGGDSRGLSFAFLTPDGKYVLRSQNDFWGGMNTKAFKVDPNGTSSTVMPEATVNGLDNISAYLPTFSPDGKKIAFINGDGSGGVTPRRSVSVMDAAIDPKSGPNGTLAFANRTTVIDNGPTGLITKFPAFMPDGQQLILQEGTNTQNGHGGMLPSYYDANTGKLMMLRGSEHIELMKANTSTRPEDYDQNFEPTVLPVTAGGYFWVVFTTQRPYGNTITTRQKTLWVAAITPNTQAGVDPSHPAFYLPNQSASENERGFWALEPCKAEGSSCGTGDECCNGFCRPSDESNPASAKVCKPPAVGSCSEIGEKCKTSADCCSNSPCIGGFCADNPPK